jgi:large subunit ribosomal protein L17
MRHRMRARKLSRTSAHRLAMYRNMVTSLLDHEQIETTDAKAKEVRRIAERMITLGKRGGLHARRRALRIIRQREVAAKVFDELAERYRERAGGYTRVLKLRQRRGDAAPISLVQLVEGGTAGGARAKSGGRETTPEKKPAPAKKAAPAAKPAKKARSKKAPAAKGGEKPAAKKSAAKKKSPSRKTAKKKAGK